METTPPQTPLLVESDAVESDAARRDGQTLLEAVKAHYESQRDIRRGICLLNAGRYDEALSAFSVVATKGHAHRSLPSYLAACWMGKHQPEVAAEHLAAGVEQDSTNETIRIRHALAQWAAGQREDALTSLREAIRVNRESAPLHFQLGTLLAAADEHEEAELRFTQAVNLDRQHTEAWVNLALCCGMRHHPADAVKYLQKAQSQKPRDVRIGLLLAQAARALKQQGQTLPIHAVIPTKEERRDAEGIEELSCVIEMDSDFVDAFLSLPASEVEEHVFAVLLATIRVALERQPEQAELHFHCGQVLHRLGRDEEAIDANERAVAIDPTLIRALIALAKLYQQTDRRTDAVSRLQQALAAGAEYADVYYLLGNLYRDRGDIDDARSAYRRALGINRAYEAARQALQALPA